MVITFLFIMIFPRFSFQYSTKYNKNVIFFIIIRHFLCCFRFEMRYLCIFNIDTDFIHA